MGWIKAEAVWLVFEDGAVLPEKAAQAAFWGHPEKRDWGPVGQICKVRFVDKKC